MIRHAWPILLSVLAAGTLRAQQLTQYTQYVFNHFSVNPAVAGSKDCIDLRLGFRKQWVDFDGAPTTGWISLHGALGAKKGKISGNRHGIGAFIEADNAGNWGYTRLLLSYAYNMRLRNDAHIAFGFFAGGQQMKFDVGRMTLAQYDDPIATSGASVLLIPEVTPGIWLYNKRSWGGLALHQALRNNIDNIGLDSRLSRHFMLSAGHRMLLGDKTSFTPSMLMKFAAAAPVAFDVNAFVEWNRTVGLGMGYRAGDAMALLMKFSFLQYFQLGYSFDLTTSKLRVASSNTHEIILGITPCSKGDMRNRMINCPAFD